MPSSTRSPSRSVPASGPACMSVSVVHGRAVADAVLAWAMTDGFAALHDCPYTPPVGPGLWEPTPPAFAPPLEPCWGQLRPFVLASGDACAPPPPPAYAEDPGLRVLRARPGGLYHQRAPDGGATHHRALLGG